MSISTTGWRGLLAVAATCVFVGACTGDDDDAEDTARDGRDGRDGRHG